MTAILGYEYASTPCMVGDLLTSAKVPLTTMKIPVSGIPANQFPIAWNTMYAAGLSQKLVKISPHLMMAWTGSKSEAVEVMNIYRDLCTKENPEVVEDYEKVIKDVSLNKYKNLSLIATYACDDGWRSTNYKTTAHKLPDGTMAAAGGSGKEYALEVFEHTIEHDVENQFNKAWGRLLLAASRMWYWDITGVSTQLAFGGGYEIAIRQNNRMVKTGDILYSNFVYIPKKGIGGIGIFKKIDYVDDTLILRVLSLKMNADDSELKVDRNATYVIPPLGIDISQIDTGNIVRELPDFNAAFYATHVKINSTDPSLEPHSTCLSFNNPNKTMDEIHFEYEEDKNIPVSIHLKDTYMQKILDAIKSTVEAAGEKFE